MHGVQKFVLASFAMTITSIILLTIGNHVFAIEYTKYTNNKYGIGFDFPKMIYLDFINPSFEQRDNIIIIPVAAKFKDSNQYKINSCAQSYHNMIPKIHRDDESYWEGSIVACTYGLYNYNVNIGDTYNVDPLLRIQIEGGAELCMLDDHCMKKINNIIKGKIALHSESSTPKLKDHNQSISPKKSPQEEEQQLIKFCATYIHALDQPQSCEDLTPELKEKVQNEAQKLEEMYANRGY